MGKITALEARAVGVHWIYAPDADVNNNPGNPIINTRPSGKNPRRVSPWPVKYWRRRQAPIFLHAANELAHKLCHGAPDFPRRTAVDDRIPGIIVDIRVRRIDPVNSDRARFECRDLAHGVSVFEIAARGKRHRRWKRRAFVQSHRVPRSKSAPISSGSFDLDWSWLFSTAVG